MSIIDDIDTDECCEHGVSYDEECEDCDEQLALMNDLEDEE